MPPDADLPDLSGLDQPEWEDALADICEEDGFWQGVGPGHLALFLERDGAAGRRLLVSFETLQGARSLPRALPRGLRLAEGAGWSALVILSQGETWFRSDPVWRTFDRWSDEGFFEDFEQVLFFGAGSCGYAAAAYSVAAPGARVLALRPQATLAPDLAGWDLRHRAARRLDFTTRYGFAPDMVEAALSAHVIYDPGHPLDAAHAALFRRPNVRLHRCPATAGQLEGVLDHMGILGALAEAAMDGRLDDDLFARLWRARRASGPYLRSLLSRLEGRGRLGLAARVCRHGLTTREAALYTTRLTAILTEMAAQGADLAPAAGSGGLAAAAALTREVLARANGMAAAQ